MTLTELHKGSHCQTPARPVNDTESRNGFTIANYKLCQVFQVSHIICETLTYFWRRSDQSWTPCWRKWQWIYSGTPPELSSCARLWVKFILPVVSYAHYSLNCAVAIARGPVLGQSSSTSENNGDERWMSIHCHCFFLFFEVLQLHVLFELHAWSVEQFVGSVQYPISSGTGISYYLRNQLELTTRMEDKPVVVKSRQSLQCFYNGLSLEQSVLYFSQRVCLNMPYFYPPAHTFITSSSEVVGIPGSRLTVRWRCYRLSASRPACFSQKVQDSQACSVRWAGLCLDLVQTNKQEEGAGIKPATCMETGEWCCCCFVTSCASVVPMHSLWSRLETPHSSSYV